MGRRRSGLRRRDPQLGWAIWTVVVINGVFSFWQEFQAERTLAALTRALPSQVQVWRDGQLGFLPAEELVAGDRIRLEEGDRVPADCRLSEAHALYLDLSVLTGESLPVARRSEALEGSQLQAKVSTGERINLVMAGSTVASGRGRPSSTPRAPRPNSDRWPGWPPAPPAGPAPWRCR